MSNPIIIGTGQTFKEYRGRTKKSLVIEGIEHWEAKDPGKWITREVMDYVEKTYGITVSYNYVNLVRAEVGHSMTQQINRSVYNALSKAVESYRP